jgi:hypothetical protein
MSCAGEETYVKPSADSMKTSEMKNFENAIKSLGKPENRPTKEEIVANGAELSERRQLLLLDAAKLFLISEGISEERLKRISTKEIVTLAFETRTKKIKEISLELKNKF